MVIAYQVLVAALAFARAGVAEPEREFMTVDAGFGHDSSVTAAQVLLAKDPAGWERLWSQHRGRSGAALPGTIQLADERPPVDFRRHFVLAIFGGTTQEVEGFRVAETLTDEKHAIVRFAPVPPPMAMATPRVAQPYGFAVLPRTKRRVQVQIPSGPNQWRTVATFDPPK